MPYTISDFCLARLKLLAQQQKNLNRKIMLLNVWSVWAFAFLILSVLKSYRNLNGANTRQFLLAMNIIFVVSFFSKFIYWKRNSEQLLSQSDLNEVIQSCTRHLKNQRKLILNHLITSTLLLSAGLIFYLFYIPAAFSLFWIIIAPVTSVLFVCSGILMFRIIYIQKQFNQLRSEPNCY